MTIIITQVILTLFLPALILWAAKYSKIIRLLSPVLTCYGVGIAMANQSYMPADMSVAMVFRNVTVAFAIPLLLFSVDILGWLRLSKATVVSFLLCVFSVLVTATLGHFVFSDMFTESNKIAGMLVGVYTGGTPNMNAIGTALKIKSEMFIALESVDMLVGATYLGFLFTLGPRLFALFLPPFPKSEGQASVGAGDDKPLISARDIGIGIVLTIIVVGAAVGVAQFLPEGQMEAGAILLITTFAIGFAMSKKVRDLKGTHEAGMYVLLIFCVAVGSSAKFDNLLAIPIALLGYICLVMLGAIALHLFLAALFRIDRDTAIITSTASVFGPAFIGPVVSVLKNREVFFSGIASGLVGYAIGNYLGLALAWALG